MKIGLFFGSFNPIHNGHLAIANYIVENSEIDKLWFVVSPQNPFKEKGELLDDQLRFEMVKLAITGYNHIDATDVEFSLPQPSYTINTLECLRSEYPGYEFFIVMGADNFIHIEKWKDYQKILSEYSFLVYPRPNYEMGKLQIGGNIKLVNAPLMNISSTEIRMAIREKRDISQVIHPAVLNFITNHKLYV